MLLAASIELGGASVPVKLRNLSEQGALIEGEELPAEGTVTIFQRKDLRLAGRVIWVEGRYAGIAFDVPLKREELLRHVPGPRAKSKSWVDYRRPGFTCRPLTNYERRNLERWLATAPTGALGE